MEGSGTEGLFPLNKEKENLLGSAQDVHIPLQGNGIAPYHCKIFCDGDGDWILQSLSKENLVQVNHDSHMITTLHHSDLLKIGDYIFVFLADEDEKKKDLPPQNPNKTTTVYARVKTFEDTRKVIESLQQTDRPETRFSILYNISALLTRVGDLEELAQKVLQAIFEEFPADRGAILIQKKEKWIPLASQTKEDGPGGEIQLSQSIINEVIQSGDGVLTKDAIADDRFSGGQSIVDLNIHSAISVPLKVEKEIVGILYIDTIQQGDVFTEDDLKLFVAVGMQISQVIQRIKLEQVKRDKEKLELQMRDAERVQQFLIPKKIFRPGGLEIGAKYILSQGLGGDYYDVLPLSGDRLGLVVADVSGHNISSALVMCMTRSLIRQLFRSETSPAKILKETNDILVEDIMRGMFITIFLGILHVPSLSFTFANGGHPHPLYFTTSKKKIELRGEGSGPPLGITKEAKYVDSRITLASEEGILIYTDGLVEMPSPSGRILGLENLKVILDRALAFPAQNMVDFIYQQALQFSMFAPFSDDLTLLCLKVPEVFRHFSFELETRIEKIDPFIQRILPLFQSHGFATKKADHFHLVLREALMNAMIHGNQKDPKKKVYVTCYFTTEKAYLQIEDEGEGFDTARMVDDFKWVSSVSSHGRGLLLIRQYMDEMDFNNKGNCIYMNFSKHT
ncbi:MAG: GAF domain-containing protein, partial [Planctomycetota bacterium]